MTTGEDAWLDEGRADDPSGPSDEQVTEALQEILASPSFASAPRSRDFLAYVVTETLAGRGHRLSERTIGRGALGRSPAFDGRLDSVVRVRARRVRQALDEYYTGEGSSAQVRVVVEAGSYVPSFVLISGSGSEVAVDLAPAVVVVRPAAAGGEDAAVLGLAVAEALVRRLTTFPGIRAIGPVEAATSDARAVGRAMGARYVVHGAVIGGGAASGGLVQLTLRLSDATTGATLWATADTRSRRVTDAFDEDEWIASIVGELGDFGGVVLRHERTAVDGSSAASRVAVMAFYASVEEGTLDSLLAAAEALDAALAAGPRDPVLVTMRASVLSVTAAYGVGDDIEADLDRAQAMAREGLAADPGSWLPHCVLATAAVARHRWEAATRHVDDALAAGPDHPTALASGALVLLRTGDWPRASALAHRAWRLNPRLPTYVRVLPALAYLLADDDAAALAEAAMVHAPGQPWGPLYRALALAGMGHLDDAWREMRQVDAVAPALVADLEGAFLATLRLDDRELAVLRRHFEPFLAGDPQAGETSDGGASVAAAPAEPTSS